MSWLVLFVILAGHYVENKKGGRSATWWPYSLWSKPAYRQVYRTTRSRMLAFFITALPGTCAVWAGVGLKSACYHQFLVPFVYWVHSLSKRRR